MDIRGRITPELASHFERWISKLIFVRQTQAHVVIDSIGGDCQASLAIHAASTAARKAGIRMSAHLVRAESRAVLSLVAFDRQLVTCDPNAVVMIHGNHSGGRRNGDRLEITLDRAYARLVARQSLRESENTIYAMLRTGSDFQFRGREIVAEGFASRIVGRAVSSRHATAHF